MPGEEDMLNHAAKLEEDKKSQPPAHFHVFGLYQWPYCNMIRDVTNTPRHSTPWRQLLHRQSSQTMRKMANFRELDISQETVNLVSEEL